MKWEYRTEMISWSESKKEGLFNREVDQEKIDAFLNEKGEEGWEVAAAFEVATRNYGYTSAFCFIMRRPR